MQKRQKVVAAIDFGTHGTGYAWAVIDNTNKDIKQRRIFWRSEWPGQPVAYPKNLTALLTKQSGEVVAWGFDAKRQWAGMRSAEQRSGLIYSRGFKMRLVDDNANPAPEQADGPLDAKGLICTYLKLIYEAALKEITKSGYTEDEIRWCLTVPAIWNEYQKQAMREAAIEAGLPADEKRLLLALEPEVAAYYARVSGVRTIGVSGKRASLMSPGSRYIVVDCGGGTVDITAYKTDSDNGLVEVGNDWGGSYGSEYINKEFVTRVLATRLGSFDLVQKIKQQCPTELLKLLDTWESEKLHVASDNHSLIQLLLPAAIDRLLDDEIRQRLGDIQDGVTDAIIVTADEARAAFDSVIPSILTLVDKALCEMRTQRRNARGEELLLLVGGFGSSPYLQERLQEHVKGKAQVFVPGDPKVAVLFGAVHYAYAPQTTARRAKFTYGCNSVAPFRQGLDPKEKQINLPKGTYCSDRFSVFVKAKELVPVDREVCHTYFPLYANQTAVTFEIYTTSNIRPVYVDQPGCKRIGSITADLSDVMHLALDDRGIQLYMLFGETQVRVRAVVQKTGNAIEADLQFDPAY